MDMNEIHSPVFNSPAYEPKPAKGGFWRVLSVILLILSILANGFLLLAIIGMGVMIAASKSTDTLVETAVIEGSRNQKIAVISIEGIIDGAMSDWAAKQIKTAEDDPQVKGLIVRIASPGGGVSASDRIHYAISRYKERTGRPVLGFMHTLATSGGYYSAVACDAIMAEPTVITGSIGVIMNHMVIKDLLEQKLGINPVTLKSGPRKDWPSLFSETTDEQKQYLDEKVIQPAYERFVQLVAQGRQHKLSQVQVRQLADGSVFSADEAVENQLIDEIGYFDHAVEAISKMADVTNPTVVEYSEELSLWSMLGAQSQSGVKLGTELLNKLLTPQIMYLWDGRR